MIVALTGLCALVLMSLSANRRFQAHEDLPMQFGFGGQVGWTMPRTRALGFTPALAAMMLIPLGILDTETGLVLWITASLIAAHGLHIWLIARWAR